MKKSLVQIFLVFSSLIAYSGNVEKQYKKLIENYDVADEAKSVTPINTSAFWMAALDNNEFCAKFIKDIQKNKSAEKEALSKTAQLPCFYPQYDETIVESMQGFCDTLLIDMGIADLGLKCSLHMVYSDEANAFTALTEDGFAMCITTELASKKGITYEILMGYVAHEFAHGALLHHARGLLARSIPNALPRRYLRGFFAVGLTAAPWL